MKEKYSYAKIGSSFGGVKKGSLAKISLYMGDLAGWKVRGGEA